VFSALAENYDNIRDDISAFIALAPVIQLRNTRDSFISNMGYDVDSLQWWLDFFGITEIFGPDWLWIKPAICGVKEKWCNQLGELERINRRFVEIGDYVQS
jgi:hypothetical protein